MKNIDKELYQELMSCAVTKMLQNQSKSINSHLAHEIEELAIELDALVLDVLRITTTGPARLSWRSIMDVA